MTSAKSFKYDIPPLTDEEEARIQAGIAADPDNPEWTEEDFKRARPFAEVFPEFAESIRRSRGRPAVEARKQQVSLRLDPDVIAKFKATGKGWQARVNEILKQAKI
ncbi:BrnA antitoxin family protein [Pararhizobium qamdonense]|uniref:BrnA antitoxin family protein n=1 Tax=Pararhizobium qamdonense TaxID=3031126 RepID=UPI0023E1F7AF|nr:BrnA antitoxin family protein [Pararhizobium qamdonense]